MLLLLINDKLCPATKRIPLVLAQDKRSATVLLKTWKNTKKWKSGQATRQCCS